MTLAPHLAELVFAVGAGDQLVGVSAFTDFPEAALALPVIGDAHNLDHEQLAVLEPDLLLAWDTGTPKHIIDELNARNFRVELIASTGLDDVPLALRRIGHLTGRMELAAEVASEFGEGLEELEKKIADAATISVFYQVHSRPLYTINGNHYVSELIELCGGANIFAELSGLAPIISVEAVLERDPEVVLASTDAGPTAFDEWGRWSEMAANRYGNQFLIPANEIGRATPRLLDGAAAVCDALDLARQSRDRFNND